MRTETFSPWRGFAFANLCLFALFKIGVQSPVISYQPMFARPFATFRNGVRGTDTTDTQNREGTGSLQFLGTARRHPPPGPPPNPPSPGTCEATAATVDRGRGKDAHGHRPRTPASPRTTRVSDKWLCGGGGACSGGVPALEGSRALRMPRFATAVGVLRDVSPPTGPQRVENSTFGKKVGGLRICEGFD